MSSYISKAESDALVERARADYDALRDGIGAMQYELADAHARADKAEQSARKVDEMRAAVEKATSDLAKERELRRASDEARASAMRDLTEAYRHRDVAERNAQSTREELKTEREARQRAETKAATEEALRVTAEKGMQKVSGPLPTLVPHAYDIQIHKGADGSMQALTLTPRVM